MRRRVTQRRAARGFVMPVVMLLALVSTLLLALVLQRSAQRTRIVREQLVKYRDSHRERGLQEMVGAWLKYSTDQNLDEMTGGGGSGGRAFTIRLQGNQRIEVSLFAAQQTARIEPIGLNAEDARVAGTTGRLLRERFGPAGTAQRTRLVGPVAIDAGRADRAVLEAVVASLIDDEQMRDSFMRMLLILRDNNDAIDEAVLLRIGAEAGLDEEAAARMPRYLTSQNTLWRIRAAWYAPPEPGRTPVVIEAYEGLIEVQGGDQSRFATAQAIGLFLDWHRIEQPPGYTADAAVPGGITR